jgi:vanillate O-demethylase monooxygenase subunit
MRALRNAWTMASWADELPATGLLARRFLDEPVVLFRDDAGQPQALADRCPHRFLPLSRGVHVNGTVRCAYHGLAFDGRGQCVHNPHGDGAIPPGAQVRRYPVIERFGALWIWLGSPERSDPALLPDFGASLDPATRIVGKDYLLARAHVQLEIDNILDLSHIEFLHGDTLGSDAVRRAETRVLQDGRTVHSLRLTRGEIVASALAEAYGIPTDRPVDRWLDVRYEVPGQLELWSGWAPAGSEDPRRAGRALPFVHLFTPETATTTHYWFATSYPRRMGEEGERRAKRDIAFLRGPFEREDLPVLEAQQRSIGERDFWSLQPVLLPGDAAAVLARRLLDALIDAECGGPTAARAAGTSALELRVAAREKLTDDICLLDLEDASGAPLPPFEAGAHLVLQLPGGLNRPYSLCGAPADRTRYRIAVRRAADSRGGSVLVHDRLSVGSRLRARRPQNRFALAAEAASHTLLAGGIGITPLLAMAEALHARGDPFTLHVFARSLPRLPFAARLREAPWAGRVRLHLSAGGPAPRIGVDALVESLPEETHLYVCGPPAFMEAATASHRAMGRPGARLHVEAFTAPGEAAIADGTPFDLELARSGRVLTVPAKRSLVQVLAEVGVPVPVSCGQGLCGTCRVRVLEGRASHGEQHIAAWDDTPDGPWVLVCCGRAETPRLVLDL